MNIAPRGTRSVYQITLEIARLEELGLLTIVKRALDDPDSKLVPDYRHDTVDPRETSPTVDPGSGNIPDEVLDKLSAWILSNPTDGSVLEYSASTQVWTPTIANRKLVIDGGNF